MIQMNNVLAGYNDVNGVHILSHGSAASVDLGNAALTTNTITSYARQLYSLG